MNKSWEDHLIAAERLLDEASLAVLANNTPQAHLLVEWAQAHAIIADVITHRDRMRDTQE